VLGETRPYREIGNRKIEQYFGGHIKPTECGLFSPVIESLKSTKRNKLLDPAWKREAFNAEWAH
jgi:hypothetical protein